MKTKNLKIARRALILAVALFGAASQGNEVEAFCSIKSGGKIYKCHESGSSCRLEVDGVSMECDGCEIAIMQVKEEAPQN